MKKKRSSPSLLTEVVEVKLLTAGRAAAATLGRIWLTRRKKKKKEKKKKRSEKQGLGKGVRVLICEWDLE